MPISRMSRRAFLALAGAPLLAQDANPYRGGPGERSEASGRFRLEKGDRWRFITPDGRPFLSFSLNHASPRLISQKYNVAHWARQFGVNIPESVEFIAGFKRRVREDLDAFGFNSLGCHSPRSGWQTSFAPYVHNFKSLAIDHWLTPRDEDFLDVFSADFERHCEQRAVEEELERLADDPYLIGYTFTDCPILTEMDAAARPVRIYGAPRAATTTWPRRLRNLPAEVPGKQAYVALMQERYASDIAGFNRVYGMSFDSFDGLAAAENWRPAVEPGNALELRDNQAFLEQIVDRYYRVMVETIRRHDSNHLILGDKLNGNTDTPDSIVEIVGRHTDAVFYQWYGYYGEQHARLDRWSALTGKPLFNGDGAFSVPNEMMPNPLGPHLPTQEDCAAAAVEYGRKVFSRPDFVGWSWCGWVETWKTMPGKETRQHSGIMDPFGKRYEPMVKALSGLAGELL